MDRQSKDNNYGTEVDEADIDGLNVEIDEQEDPEEDLGVEDSDPDRPDETEGSYGPALQELVQEMPVFFGRISASAVCTD